MIKQFCYFFFPLDLNFVKEIFNSPEVSSTFSFSNACSQVVILFKEAMEPSGGRTELEDIDRKGHTFRLGDKFTPALFGDLLSGS